MPVYNNSLLSQYNSVPSLYRRNINIANVRYNTSFAGNPEGRKTDSNNSSKWGIGIGVTVLSIAGVLCGLYRKGHSINPKLGLKDTLKEGWNSVKKSFEKFRKKGGNTDKTPETNKPEVVKPEPKVNVKPKPTDVSAIRELYPVVQSDIKQYSSLEGAISDYRAKLATGNYEVVKEADGMLKTLVKHNYSNDNSYVQIVTRTRNVDFDGHTLDILNKKEYQQRLLDVYREDAPFRIANAVGDYSVHSLSNGQKIVSLSVPTGRYDGPNGDCRPIREMIAIVSKDSEFTPLQKDLIEIISHRKQYLSSHPENKADILSLSTLSNNKVIMDWGDVNGQPYEVNAEILLSSIATAKKQLKPQEMDKEFIQKALSLKNGEKIEQHTWG